MDILKKEVHGRVMYRAGTAARLAGLPVETLRVWERRYRLSDVQRSEHGQRLYSVEHVERLALLKQLVDQGHAIGLLAELRPEELKTMLGAGACDRPAGRIAPGRTENDAGRP